MYQNLILISFLQPIALFGLFLALTPILIHLLNLMRHRTQPWAAMRFIRQAKKIFLTIVKIKEMADLAGKDPRNRLSGLSSGQTVYLPKRFAFLLESR